MARLQTNKRQLELIHMKEKENISQYVTRITRLVNHIKIRGESIGEHIVANKI